MNEAAYSARAAGLDDVQRALDVLQLQVRRLAPVLDLRGAVKGHLAAVRAVPEGSAVAEVPAHRLGAEVAPAPRRSPSARGPERPSPRGAAVR